MKNLKLIVFSVFAITMMSCSDDDDNTISDPDPDPTSSVEFVTIPTEGEIVSFEMGVTEVTNEQYAQFLNDANAAGIITYDTATKLIFNSDGNPMIDLAGSRVIRDHNGDGTITHHEMENPLNRCMIEFNESTSLFEVVDPVVVNWADYCNPSLYPGAADSLDDWAELNDANTGWFGTWDTDNLLPTLDEVKQWPVGFIRWYGADEFAQFYGYDLPSMAQWKVGAKAGQNFQFATSDGSVSTSTAVYNDLGVGQRNRGHVQGVKSIPPNPYGLYSMGGNTWEHCKDWFRPAPGDVSPIFDNETGEFFIDDTLTSNVIDPSLPAEGDNLLRKAGIGGSWNYFDLLMGSDRDGLTPFMATGNDHFGFRVVKNN